MKKILFLSGWYYPDSVGGTENYVCWLAKELNKKNCKVQIAAPAIDAKEADYNHEGLAVYRYPVSLAPSRQELRGQAPQKYSGIFARWLKENKPDLVHIHSFTRGCGLNQAKVIKQIGIPLVFTAHMPDCICKRGTMMRWGRIPCDGKIKVNRCAACYLQKRRIPKFLSRLIMFVPYFISKKFRKRKQRLSTVLAMKSIIFEKKKSLEKLFKITDKIIVVSNWLYKVMLVNHCPESKLSLIKHGLYNRQKVKKEKKLRRINNCLVIGYIGRFGPEKGVHVLIKAVKKLPKNINVKLKIYGRTNNEEEKKYFQNLKKYKGNDTRIDFLGQLRVENQKKFFQEIDILAVPSLWLETGPLVVLEAFFYQTPVLGSNLGGIAELVNNKKNGILVEAGNIDAWRKQIKNIYFNHSLINNMSESIGEVKNIEQLCLENLAIYDKILSKR